MTPSPDLSQYKNDLFAKLGFDFERGNTILDVGCGDGTDIEIFAKSYGLLTSGIDILKHENLERLNVEFTEASILQIPFDDGSFDYVFTHDVLHHIDEAGQSRSKLLRGLRELARVIKPSGYVIIIEANRYNILTYPHMVVMRGHNHLPQSLFVDVVSEVFGNATFKFFEAHLYPSRLPRLWRAYDAAMDRWAPKQLLSYNAAIAGPCESRLERS